MLTQRKKSRLKSQLELDLKSTFCRLEKTRPKVVKNLSLKSSSLKRHKNVLSFSFGVFIQLNKNK